MALHEEFSTWDAKDILSKAQRLKSNGWRYVQILATGKTENLKLVYSFMKGDQLGNYLVEINKFEDTVPSISRLYPEAFVCENEMHDLFGVVVENISIDFSGTFYQTAVRTPMSVISREEYEAAKAQAAQASQAAQESKEPQAAQALAPQETNSVKDGE